MTEDWIDKHGLVKTWRHQDSTGNGFLYTMIAMILDKNYYNPRVISLWDAKRKVLMRTPDNAFGQESHDNYIALGLYCLMFNRRWARAVLWSAFKKFTFMRNDFKEKGGLWKSFMGRFPHLWMIFIAAAYPWTPVKWLCGLGLRALSIFDKKNYQDASGTQLQFVKNYALSLMGHEKCMKRFMEDLDDHGTSMNRVMSSYYDEGHPVLSGYEIYTADNLYQ